MKLLIGVPYGIVKNGDLLKACAYAFARGVQEVAGNLICFVNEPYGRYHIEESHFQKSLYFSYLTKTSPNLERCLVDIYGGAYEITHLEITARDILDLKKELRELLYPITQNLEQLKDWLDEITLFDCEIPLECSKLKYALMDDPTFFNLNLDDLLGLNRQQLSFINKRMQQRVDHCRNDFPTNLRDLMELSPEGVARHKERLPPIAFAFLTQTQLKGTLPHLSKVQTDALFFILESIVSTAIETVDVYARHYNPGYIQQRAELYTPEERLEALKSGKFSNAVLKNMTLSEEDISCLSNLSKETIDAIFRNKNNQGLFAKFSSSDVQEALEKGVLGSFVRLITPDQRERFDYSRFSVDLIDALFPNPGFEAIKAVFSWKYEDEDKVECGIKDSFMRDISRTRSEENGKNLSALTQKQRDDIEAKLYKKEHKIEIRTVKEREESKARDKESMRFFKAALSKKQFGHDIFSSAEFASWMDVGPVADPNKLSDSYTLLGVTEATSRDDVTKAYKKLAVKIHPDKNQEADAKEKFQDLSNAYVTILDHIDSK